MAKRNKTTAEKGKFKEEIHTALFKSENIRELLLGDTTGMSASKVRAEFKNHVMSHLFIDDTIEETNSYIFYDVVFPYMQPNIKTCRVVMYIMCHRDILDDYRKEGYFGNRADILSQMVEDALINDDSKVCNFGIGDLVLDSVEIYNSIKFYGCIMTFNVPTFR